LVEARPISRHSWITGTFEQGSVMSLVIENDGVAEPSASLYSLRCVLCRY